MTNKYIIDGVDVSECSHHEGKLCSMSREAYCYCSDKPNCIYKRFKRKEQECEELKKTIMYKCPQCYEEYLSPIGASLYEENNKLKQTLAEIKEICSEINCESLMQNSWCGNTDFKMGCCERLFKKQILQKISEVDNES